MYNKYWEETKFEEKKKPIKIRKSRDPKDEDVDIDVAIHKENSYGDFNVNEEPLLDVDISYLQTIIEEKSKNENNGFKKEYAVCSFFFLLKLWFCVQFSRFDISSNHKYSIIRKWSFIRITMTIKPVFHLGNVIVTLFSKQNDSSVD